MCVCVCVCVCYVVLYQGCCETSEYNLLDRMLRHDFNTILNLNLHFCFSFESFSLSSFLLSQEIAFYLYIA